MTARELMQLVVDAQADGREFLILATMRDREPGRRIRVTPGLVGDVVGTEPRDGSVRVIVQVRVADAMRYLVRHAGFASTPADGRGTP